MLTFLLKSNLPRCLRLSNELSPSGSMLSKMFQIYDCISKIQTPWYKQNTTCTYLAFSVEGPTKQMYSVQNLSKTSVR